NATGAFPGLRRRADLLGQGRVERHDTRRSAVALADHGHVEHRLLLGPKIDVKRGFFFSEGSRPRVEKKPGAADNAVQPAVGEHGDVCLGNAIEILASLLPPGAANLEDVGKVGLEVKSER